MSGSREDELLAGAAARISRKERTCSEVEEWLVAEGADEELAFRVITRLTELKLLDDEKFASLYAEDKRVRSGWGSDRIQRALLDRGVEYGLATNAASSGVDDEVERAVKVLEERDYDLEEPTDRQKALGVLARRGYQAEVAYDAIRRARRSAHPEPPASRQDRPSGAASTR